MNKHGCDIVAVGKRRDGGTRYWCLSHHADATAKYGVPAEFCVAAHDTVILESEILTLEIDPQSKGIAFEAALPPAYDTTEEAPLYGIRVLRLVGAGADTKIETTLARRLRISVCDKPTDYFEIDALDLLNHAVSTTFGFETKFVACTLCGFVHLDRDWFAVHRHKRHLCHGCGRHFTDSEPGIGNPVTRLFSIFKSTPLHPTGLSKKSLRLSSAEFAGGIQLKTSPPTIAWEKSLVATPGIHVTAFETSGLLPRIDGEYGSLEIDGIVIDYQQISTYSAQMVMPHIRERVVALSCPHCGEAHFDIGEHAFTPHSEHECETCSAKFTSTTRLKLTISNPFVDVRHRLAAHARTAVREHVLNLRAETI